MIKKILIAVAFMACFASKASAYEKVYQNGFSTWTVTGVLCSTGTPIDISAFPLAVGSTYTAIAIQGSTTALIGYENVLYQLENANSLYDVFIGHDANVSTSSSSVNMGIKMVGTSTGTVRTFNLGWNPNLGIRDQLFCIAQGGAGSMGVRLTRTIFGYK